MLWSTESVTEKDKQIEQEEVDSHPQSKLEI